MYCLFLFFNYVFLQVQSKHFGDSLKLSIEGYAVHHFSDYGNPIPEPKMDFHSYLSDDRTQNSATVKWHMDHLIKLLLKQNYLKVGGRILATTDGCASQYRSGTSVYFQTVQAVEFNVILVRCYTEAGHGKSVVDGLNGVDKMILSRATFRKNQSADDALKTKDNVSLKIHSYNSSSSGEEYSCAVDCQQWLREKVGELGAITIGPKREKRQATRGTKTRHWHVRPITERLLECKAHTIQIPDKGVTFKDMYQTMCHPKLGVGRAAMRRVACFCKACDTMSRAEWVPLVAPENQPMFQQAKDCELWDVLEEKNKWYIVDVEMSPDKGVPEDASKLLHGLLYNRTATMSNDIEIGSFGAVCTEDEDNAKDGYYVKQFTSLPFTAQVENGGLQVKGVWLSELDNCTLWFYHNFEEEEATVDMHTVLATNLDIYPISPENKPKGVSKYLIKEAEEHNALRLPLYEHDAIMEEMQLRDTLEHDPTEARLNQKVEVAVDESDSESDDE